MPSGKYKEKQWDITIVMEKIIEHWTANAGECMEQQELLFIAAGNVKLYSHFERQVGGFYKVHILSPHNPTTVLLDICQKKLKTNIYIKISTWMLIIALFVIHTWKRPRCPSVGKWINYKLDNGILFSTKKR